MVVNGWALIIGRAGGGDPHSVILAVKDWYSLGMP